MAHELGKPSERAFQELESFLFAIEPTLLVFIDDVDRDLRDFTSALAISSAVYRVKKLNIDGRIDFYSPDQKQPTIQTDDAGTGHELSTDLDILDQLGGGEVSNATGRFKCYKLSDGRTINIKRSKLHERGNYFWFGLGTAAMEYAEEFGVTDFVFVLGDRGIAVVPAHIVTDFVGTTNVASVTEDGRIRHYHFLISNDPSPHLYWSKEFPSVDLSEYFQIFD